MKVEIIQNVLHQGVKSCDPQLESNTQMLPEKKKVECVSGIEYRSDDVTKNFFWISVFWIYHVSVEHDEKHPQPKLGGNRFMGARDMTV